MARLGIYTGTAPDAGDGDTLLGGAVKINSNFTELYTILGDGTNLLAGIVTSIVAGSNVTISGATGQVTVNAGAGGTWSSSAGGISTSKNVGIGSDSPTSKLTVVGNSLVTGISTANAFYGSGTNLSGIVTSIVAGTNVTISGSTGQVIINASGGSIAGIDTVGTSYFNQLSVSGVSTFSGDIKFSGTYGDNGALWDESEGALIFKDGRQIRLGDGGDLRIYHDVGGSHSYIQDTGTGNLRIISNGGAIELLRDTTETMAKFNTDGSVELYYDNSKKFETLGTGVTVTGTTFTNQLSVSGISTLSIGGAGNPEAVYFQSTTQPQASLKISQATGNDYGVLMTFTSSDGNEATIETDSNSNLIVSTDGSLNLRANGSDTLLQGQTSCGLYYSNVKKFETLGAGVTVTGTTFTNQLSVSGVATISSGIDVDFYSVRSGVGTFTASAGVAYTANSWTISTNDFKTAEYTIWLQYNNDIQSQKVLVMNDGTTAYSQEYAIMYNNSPIVSIGATINSGDVEIWFTPEIGISGVTTYRFTRQTML